MKGKVVPGCHGLYIRNYITIIYNYIYMYSLRINNYSIIMGFTTITYICTLYIYIYTYIRIYVLHNFQVFNFSIQCGIAIIII